LILGQPLSTSPVGRCTNVDRRHQDDAPDGCTERNLRASPIPKKHHAEQDNCLSHWVPALSGGIVNSFPGRYVLFYMHVVLGGVKTVLGILCILRTLPTDLSPPLSNTCTDGTCLYNEGRKTPQRGGKEEESRPDTRCYRTGRSRKKLKREVVNALCYSLSLFLPPSLSLSLSPLSNPPLSLPLSLSVSSSLS